MDELPQNLAKEHSFAHSIERNHKNFQSFYSSYCSHCILFVFSSKSDALSEVRAVH